MDMGYETCCNRCRALDLVPIGFTRISNGHQMQGPESVQHKSSIHVMHVASTTQHEVAALQIMMIVIITIPIIITIIKVCGS